MSDRSRARCAHLESGGGSVLSRVTAADRVVGGAYLATAAGVVAVAGAEAGTGAAVALGGVMVGLPALVGGVFALAHYQATGDGAR